MPARSRSVPAVLAVLALGLFMVATGAERLLSDPAPTLSTVPPAALVLAGACFAISAMLTGARLTRERRSRADRPD